MKKPTLYQFAVSYSAEKVRRALKHIPAERIFVDPDCGLKTRTVDEAREKLRVIVEAVRRVRDGL